MEKEKVINAKDIDSVVTGTTTGHPVRVLRNKMTKEYIRLEHNGVGYEELERMTLGSLRKAVIDGDKDNNDSSNLEWATPSENIAHAVRTGLSPQIGNIAELNRRRHERKELSSHTEHY